MSLKTVFISTYTFIREGRRTNDAGPVKPLRDYFAQRSAAVCLMEQPLPGSDHLHPILTDFRSGRLHRQSRLPMTLRLGKGTASFDSNRTYLRLKLRDLLSNAWALLKTRACHRRTGIDLFVGVESLNALCGILFKRLGLVRAVVYYVFDWAPDRFANPLMNAVYLWMDRMATYYSDATWNITYAIGDARRDLLHYPPGRMSPQIYVPYSPGLPNVPGAAVEKADDNLIIYAGGLIPENGPDLLLQAFRQVFAVYPAARLWIIGSGELETDLQVRVQRWGLQDAVVFHGYVADEQQVLRLQRRGAIGAAPYPAIPGSRKPFGDVIKIRMYFSTGLATVTTGVPPVAHEIRKESLGIVTPDDSPEAYAAGLLALLQDKQRLAKCRRNALAKARRSTWTATYSAALRQMGVPDGNMSRDREAA